MPQIKGTFFLNTVKALRRHGDAARHALPETLRPYLETRVLPSSWYPEEDHLELLRALVRLGSNRRGAWEELGVLSAEREMGSVYKVLLRQGDPDGSFDKLRSIWSLGHDTGSLEPERLAQGKGRLELHDYPLQSEELCRLNTAFFETVLRRAGAEDAELHHIRCRARGAPVCVWDVTWTAR